MIRALPTILAPLMLLVASLALAPVAHAAPEGDATHAAETHTAEHGDHGHEKGGVIPGVKQGLVTGLATIIVFGIVLFILGTQVWPKILGGLNERSEKIRSEIAGAEEARKQAKRALEEYEANLAEARAESQKMLENTKAEQAKLAADLKARADKELSEMRDKAMRDIDAAKRQALNEVYSEAALLATTVAAKILKREISEQDTSALIDESLTEIGAARN
ncbi:MAG: F0F1 ATP synthase subunit B [Planctomycetota bacterium]